MRRVLTPSMKVRRHLVRDLYQAELEELYWGRVVVDGRRSSGGGKRVLRA